MSNVPDDWGNYFTTCSTCGERYHESEGDCGNCDKCEWCDKWFTLEELENNGGMCNDCLCCETCGELTEDNHRYFIIGENEDFDPENLPTKKNGKLECEVLCLDCLGKYKDDLDDQDYRFIRADEN
ncbi:MAG: hypothetical protein ACTSW7_00535 [Candidatus Thorarchaeota archaeon]|nr:MAG: hypothetical protein DRP42_02795 [Mycoplasmatota bacterium]HEC72612.1 hypothetical protein [Thermoplasmatales archaeon]